MTPQPTLEEFGERPFSFYPPLLGVEHNEWTYRKSTWSEILVQNTQSDLGIWIPRRFLGEVSQVEKPVMIVGLRRELEYRGGAVWPHERRVVEMPNAISQKPAAAQSPASQNVQMGGAESKVGRLMMIAIGIGIFACIVVVLLLREGGPAHPIVYNTVLQSDLGFSGNDDYYSVVNRLGPPTLDHWRSDQGELQYRLLWYPKQELYVVLMGADRKDSHYIGALDKNWRVVHSVDNNKEAMLRSLKKF
jgi:hypothetical protein